MGALCPVDALCDRVRLTVPRNAHVSGLKLERDPMIRIGCGVILLMIEILHYLKDPQL